MKFVEKITLIIYSNIILIMSVILCAIIFGWIDVRIVGDIIKIIICSETSSKVVLLVSIIFILLSIRCIFFDPTSKKELKEKQGVLLANDNGKLMISKETIQNLVESVTKEFKEAKEISTNIKLDNENNLNVAVALTVTSNIIIKELTANLQNKIKEKIKTTTDLEVKEVDVTIKKVATDVKE